ncbi:MAG: DUF4157 domain-containing protein [Bacteroidota bacterium]
MYQQLEKKEKQAKQQPQFQRKEKPNRTGLPDNLKDGIERLSGFDMSDVRVHYNSNKPAQLNAHAYAQGNQIHLGAGQERHLPHEAWHVVQQKQGRVRPTMTMNGQAINNNVGLEKEADVMGGKALQMKSKENLTPNTSLITKSSNTISVAQRWPPPFPGTMPWTGIFAEKHISYSLSTNPLGIARERLANRIAVGDRINFNSVIMMTQEDARDELDWRQDVHPPDNFWTYDRYLTVSVNENGDHDIRRAQLYLGTAARGDGTTIINHLGNIR